MIIDNNCSNNFIEIIKNYNPIISFISSFFTVIAVGIALYTVAIWKKQQKYSIQLNLLMNLEDNYEILFIKYMEEYHWIIKLQNTMYINKRDNYKNVSKEELNKTILEEYDKKKLNDDLIYNTRKYEISYLRAKRFFPTIDSCKSLMLSYMDEIFNKHIKKIENMLNKENSVESIFEKYAEEFLVIKNNAIQEITALRKKL